MGDFYVYIHRDTDGEIFYVGKGSNARAFTKSGRSKRWQERAADGYAVEFAGKDLTDAEAREVEASLIAEYSDTLVNVRPRDNSPTKIRAKTIVGTALSPEILARLDTWRDRQEFKPSKSATVELALREFLEKHDGAKAADITGRPQDRNTINRACGTRGSKLLKF